MQVAGEALHPADHQADEQGEAGKPGGDAKDLVGLEEAVPQEGDHVDGVRHGDRLIAADHGVSGDEAKAIGRERRQGEDDQNTGMMSLNVNSGSGEASREAEHKREQRHREQYAGVSR